LQLVLLLLLLLERQIHNTQLALDLLQLLQRLIVHSGQLLRCGLWLLRGRWLRLLLLRLLQNLNLQQSLRQVVLLLNEIDANHLGRHGLRGGHGRRRRGRFHARGVLNLDSGDSGGGKFGFHASDRETETIVEVILDDDEAQVKLLREIHQSIGFLHKRVHEMCSVR
jgi:hypothetical protein